jgi:predicted TIM-barrel fold metal-dependent hydrolase
MRRPRLVRKCDYDAIRDLYLPIPTQVVSNEEFLPIAQTAKQEQVEAKLLEIAAAESKRLGVSRRAFLRSSGGMAAAFLALNAVWGCRAFDVDPAEVTEPGAGAEKWPKPYFIFDVQTHHVAAGRQIEVPPLLRYREFGAMMGNKDLENRQHAWEDVYLANYVKEVFLDSDTVVAVITGLPSRTETQNVLPPAEMVETRAQVNGIAKSRRLLAHGLFSPELGSRNMEEMHRQVEQLRIEAWKGYPGQPLLENGTGWWMDDERLAYPAYEYSRKVGIRTICVHKGLALPGWDTDHSSPRDIPKAARDFPDMNFLVYHSALKSLQDAMAAAQDDFRTTQAIPWISDLCEARKKNPEMTNVYMELGTTFGMVAVSNPRLAAYMLGLMIDAFGDDHVLWGTDSIWWGSPQWQIEAFRRLQMPGDLMQRFGFAPLTDAVKRNIFGLNAARIYGVDPQAKLKALPHDALTQLKRSYRAAGGLPSNTQYGWVAT